MLAHNNIALFIAHTLFNGCLRLLKNHIYIETVCQKTKLLI